MKLTSSTSNPISLLGAAVALFLVGGAARQASAAVVSYEFSAQIYMAQEFSTHGHLNEVFGDMGTSMGQPITINFSYDTSTVDTSPSPNVGIYSFNLSDPSIGMEFSLAGKKITPGNYGASVEDNSPGPPSVDLIRFGNDNGKINVDGVPLDNSTSWDVIYMGLSFTASSSLRSGDGLPETINLNDYTTPGEITARGWLYEVYNGDAVLESEGIWFTLLPKGPNPGTVPEAGSTALLLLLALSVLGLVRRS